MKEEARLRQGFGGQPAAQVGADDEIRTRDLRHGKATL